MTTTDPLTFTRLRPTDTRISTRCGHYYALRPHKITPAWTVLHAETDTPFEIIGAFGSRQAAERHANADLADRIEADFVDVAGYLAALIVGFTIFGAGGLGAFLALVEVFGR